jgi:hypothetical protein
MRNLMTDYELIGAARAARRAASDSLRAIQAQEDAGAALTPEFLLDLKLTTQSRLADAETQEYQALTDYSTAIANFYRSMGTLLERNHIDFRDPLQGELPAGIDELAPRLPGPAAPTTVPGAGTEPAPTTAPSHIEPLPMPGSPL